MRVHHPEAEEQDAPARPDTPLPQASSDIAWRDAIIAGDVDAWHSFVRRYSELAVEAAIRWCDLGCRFPGGCSLKRGPGSTFSRFLSGDCRCDRVGTAYYFILEKLREKVAFYRGDRGCRLDTWVRHLLHPYPRLGASKTTGDYGYRQLYADYVRKFEGRIRAPLELCRSSQQLEQIYLLVNYGRDESSICQTLGLTRLELQQSIEQIQEILRQKVDEFYWRFWGHLFMARPQDQPWQALAEEDEELEEPAAPCADQQTELEAAAIQRALACAMQSLPPLTRHLLWLAVDEGMSATEISAELAAHDLARLTSRQVYAELDRAIKKLCVEVSLLLAPLAPVDVQPRRMKSILEFWSVARFLPVRSRPKASQ